MLRPNPLFAAPGQGRSRRRPYRPHSAAGRGRRTGRDRHQARRRRRPRRDGDRAGRLQPGAPESRRSGHRADWKRPDRIRRRRQMPSRSGRSSRAMRGRVARHCAARRESHPRTCRCRRRSRSGVPRGSR